MSLFSAALRLQFRLLSRSPFFLSMALLTPVVYATIAGIQVGAAGAVPFRIVLGAGLLGVWSTTLFGAAEALFMQRFSGTLELLVGAPRSLLVPVLGFSCASVLLGLYSIGAVWLWSTVAFHVEPLTASTPVTVLSLVVSFVGLAAVGVALAGVYVLTRQAMAISNMMEYPVWIVCGVLTPATSLWPPLLWIGKLLPLGWTVAAIDEVNPVAALRDLAVAVAVAVGYFGLAEVVLARVDLLARVAGTLRLR